MPPMILGQPKTMEEVGPLSVSEGNGLAQALQGLMGQGVPMEFNFVLPFLVALKVGQTIQTYREVLDLVRTASEMDEALQPTAYRAAAEKARDLLERPNGMAQLQVAIMPPMNMAMGGAGGPGMASPGKLITP